MRALSILGFLALLAVPARAQERILATDRPDCVAGGPMELYILDASSASDCDATGGGGTEAHCCCLNGTWAGCGSTGGGSGTVTSVGLTMPAEFSVAGSPVTTSGTLAVTEATQTANTVYSGPTSGGAAAPGFRALVAADIPAAADPVALDLQADGGSDSTDITEIEARGNHEGWYLSEPTANVATFDGKAATDQALAFKPGSADTPDDEFNSTTLDAKWSTARWSGCASGTVDLLETGDVEEYDLSTQPGWLLVAAGSTSAYGCGFGMDYEIPDGKSLILKAAMSQFVNVNNGHQYGVTVCDTSTCTNYIQVFVDQDLNANRCFFQEVGTATGSTSSTYVDAAFIYLRLARSGLTYYGFCSTNGVTWTNLGSVTAAAAAGYVEIFSGAGGTQQTGYTVPISAFDWVRLGTNGLNPW